MVPAVRPTSRGEPSAAPGTKPVLTKPCDQATPLLALHETGGIGLHGPDSRSDERPDLTVI